MAPQETDQQELHAPLIPLEEEQQSSLTSEQSHLLDDQLDVVVVQPEGNLVPSLSSVDDDDEGKVIRNSGNNGNRKKKGGEVPVNCPHLETALFFFGIAGMIVSVLMLLQHIVSRLISSYY